MKRNRSYTFLFVAASMVLATIAGFDAPALAKGVDLTADELEIWEDPDFRRRFVESYIAETDLEPKPTSVDEVNAINKTLQIMSGTDDADEKDAKKKKKDDKPETEKPEQVSQKEIDSRLEKALAYVLDQRKQNPKFSVLIDFLIANLRLNKAMNIGAQDDKASDAVKRYNAARKQRLLKQAAEGYRKCTIKHGKYRRAWRNYAIVNLRLQEYKAARDGFKKVIMLGGGDPDTYGLLGFCYTTLGDHLPAESAFRMANLLDPDKKDWRMGLIRSFLLQKRYPATIAMSTQMLKKDPTNDQLWLFQANAYIGMEKFDKAAENYEILDGMGKSTVQTLNLLANIYTNKGLYDTAVDRYTKALKLANEGDRKSMLPRLINAASVLSSRGEKSRDATKALIQTIERNYKDAIKKKDRATLLRLSARLALAEGADDKQAKILAEVVKLDPLDGDALILLGQHHTRQQEWDKAINYLERAAKIEGFEADAKVRHAQALVLSDRPAQALPLLREAQQIKPRESVQQYLEAVEKLSR